MKLIEDSRQQAGKHELKHAYWVANGDDILRCKLPFGDYALPPKVAVDTKADMDEIANNIGGAEHRRFRDECKLAQEYDCQLYVLVENTEGIHSLEDVARWVNPRLQYSPKAISGPRLQRAMQTMQSRYGVRFLFCRPEEAAATVNKLLEEGRNGEG